MNQPTTSLKGAKFLKATTTNFFRNNHTFYRHIIGNSKICSKLNSDRQNDQQEKNTAINEERKQVVQTSDQCFHNLMSAKIKESPSMLISLPYKHCFDDANFVDFVDYILQHNADGLDLFEIGLDVNYYISKLNKILNKPLMHNVYIMDTAVCTGRIFTEIISLVGGSRIKKKIHFVGIDVHPVVLAKAKYNVDRQIRQGSGRNVDCLAINFVKSPLDDILSESHNKHFHVIIVGQGSFHRLLTNSERLTFFQSVYSALLPNGICIMNIFPDLNVLSDKSHMHILPAKIEYPTVSENSTVNSQQKFYKSYNLIDRTIARSHSIDDTASIYTNGNDCFDLNIKREISRCSDNPAEIILSFSFELTSFETKHAHNPCHKCSINLRSASLAKLIPLIDSAGLEIAEKFKSFKQALQGSDDSEQCSIPLTKYRKCNDEIKFEEPINDSDDFRVFLLKKKSG